MACVMGLLDRTNIFPKGCGRSVYLQDIITANHPASVNRAKVMELLGAVSSKERQQINSLLDRTCLWDEASIGTAFTEDYALFEHCEDDDCSGDIDEGIGSSYPPYVAEPAISGPSCIDMTYKNGVHVPQPMSSPKPTVPYKPGYLPAGRGSMDFVVKENIVQKFAMRPQRLKMFRLLGLADKVRVQKSARWSAKLPWLCTPQCHFKKVGSCRGAKHVGSFPFYASPCFEKHYLPSPQDCTAKEAKPTAHPLPQPPLSRPPSDEQTQSCVIDADKLAPRNSVYKSSAQYAASSQCSVVSPDEFCKGAPQITPSSEAATQCQSTSHQTKASQSLIVNHYAHSAVPPLSILQVPKAGHSHSVLTVAQKSPHLLQSSPKQSPRWDMFSSHVVPYVHSTESLPSLLQFPKEVHLQSIVNIAQRSNDSPLPSVEQGKSSSQGPPISASIPPQLSESLFPQKWTRGVVLGQGTFGVVYEGLNLEDGSFFAVKISNTEDVPFEIQQEIDVLSKLKHPNIVRYFGSSFENGHLCIFLELVRMGSLETILQTYKQFEDDTIRSYTRQMLLGLEYLHANKTIHRDIKCANILVDVDGQVKLSDFGVAKQMDDSLASSLKGTPLYMAPEVWTQNKHCYSFSADIWSLGCTVLEMADGRPPWSNLEGFEFLFKVEKGELPPMPEHLSPEGKDFVCKCLKLNVKDRPTATELLQHPFVKDVCFSEEFFPEVPTSIMPSCNTETSLFPSLRNWQCEDEHGTSASTQCTLTCI